MLIKIHNNDNLKCSYTGCKVSSKSLADAGHQLVRFLRLKYGTLSRAFSSDVSAVESAAKETEMKKLFSLLFLELLLDIDMLEKSGTVFLDTKTLHAPNDIQVIFTELQLSNRLVPV